MQGESLRNPWRFSPDLRAMISAVVILALGATVVALLTNVDKRGTPVTVLLAVTILMYAMVSGRVSEFSGPGGWKAKFAAVAARSVSSAGYVEQASLKMRDIPKGDAPIVKNAISRVGGDDKPIALIMVMAHPDYKEDNLKLILDYLALTRNFRALVVVDEAGKLVGYAPARQAAFLSGGGESASSSRKLLVDWIVTGQTSGRWDRELMTDACVTLGTSFADALEKMNKRSLSCIAVIDDAGHYRGIIDRDHIVASLLLSLAHD
jgi:CBS domain-containing protein